MRNFGSLARTCRQKNATDSTFTKFRKAMRVAKKIRDHDESSNVWPFRYPICGLYHIGNKTVYDGKGPADDRKSGTPTVR